MVQLSWYHNEDNSLCYKVLLQYNEYIYIYFCLTNQSHVVQPTCRNVQDRRKHKTGNFVMKTRCQISNNLNVVKCHVLQKPQKVNNILYLFKKCILCHWYIHFLIKMIQICTFACSQSVKKILCFLFGYTMTFFKSHWM